MATLTFTDSCSGAMLSAAFDLLDEGTTNASGRISLVTSGGVEVASLAMSNPAASTPSGKVVTLGTITPDSDADGGVASSAKFLDRDDNLVFTADAGGPGSGAYVVINPSNAITAGAQVTVSVITATGP